MLREPALVVGTRLPKQATDDQCVRLLDLDEARPAKRNHRAVGVRPQASYLTQIRDHQNFLINWLRGIAQVQINFGR